MAEELKMITPDMLAPDPFRPAVIDFEQNMSAAPLFALALIAANIGVFIWELSVGALKSKAAVIAAGAIYGEKVFNGQGWRLVTGMFMHASFGHLLGNCLAIYLLGLAAEQAWGRGRALGIYFTSGLFASFASALLETRPSVGASGAIFGLMGAVLVFFFRYSSSFYARNRRVGIVLCAWGLLQLYLGSLSAYVDNWAHLGGFAAGAVLGMLAPSRLFKPVPSVK